MKNSTFLPGMTFCDRTSKLRSFRSAFLTLTAILYSLCMYAQVITGVVTEGTTGEPVIGASVIEKGNAGNGTITDVEGKFSMTLTSSDAVLTISFVGFQTVDVPYTGDATMNISLNPGALLDEVVVTALGISRDQKALGYATTQIKAADLSTTQVTNVASALYGKAPGVSIRSVPGGATSGVNINIRGFSSITGNTQPLIVMDGVPIRNGEFNNTSYWSDQRIRGNGLNDINPEDIESISILKGASAAALYGSDAVNGVVLITSKKANKKKGLGVEFVASYGVDKIAYLPRYQNVRGPGYFTNLANAGQDENGFIMVDANRDGTPDTRGLINTTVNFGPRFDGQPVMSWDGVVRPYVASNNSYADLFQPANSASVTAAVSQGGEKASFRFSFTRQDNEMISIGSKNERNIANLTTNFQINDKLSTNINIKYINQYTKNRPYKVDRMINNFSGMMDRFESADWYFNRYRTSAGYRYRTNNQPSLTPEENIIFGGFKGDIADYVWRLFEHNTSEHSNRIIANISQSYEIIDGLSLTGRIATDFTAERIEDRRSTDNPSVLYANPGGYFGLSNSNNSLVYGDAILSFKKNITSDLGFSAMAGYTAQKDQYFYTLRGTSGGLSTENFFDIAASINTPAASNSRRSVEVRDALIGTVGFDYKGFAFIEGTVRRDRTSRLAPENNTFTYPSVNASFIPSEAWDLPKVIEYAKIRASYGVVGNYPTIYQANIAYNQRTLGVQAPGSRAVLYTNIGNNFGNDRIRPEQKQEFEIGAEVNFLGRFGLVVSYYDAKVVDQILPVDIPSSSGARRVLSNIGTLRNKGLEISLDADIIQTQKFSWNSRINYARNTNTVEKLANDATELLHADFDGNAAQIRSVVGRPMGDIYAHPVKTDAQGRNIVGPNGIYQLDGDKWEVYGNALPDFEGGFINNLTFGGVSLDIITDFSVGGAIMPTGVFWLTSRGLTEESLTAMDAESGGLRYYVNGDGQGVATSGDRGPNGEQVFNDGILQEGVLANGETNTNIISQARYYNAAYNWGGPQYGNSRYDLYINENNWWKVRELSLGFRIPKAVASKIGMQNARISAFGRNLFFLYRSIKDIDPEQTTSGTRWYQNVNNAGNNPSFRSFGVQLNATF